MTTVSSTGGTGVRHAERARTSVLWNTGFSLFRDGLQLGVSLLLVRLLPPEVYGQFGFVTALITFLTLCSFREFLNHTLLVRDESDVHYQDHFTAGLVIQVFMFGLANVIAVALRWVPAYAAVAPAVHLMSVLFLLDLPAELRTRMLERALDWRRLRALHVSALIAGGALSIVMAVRGWGVYALLVPTLLFPLPILYDLFVREGWRPSLTWSWPRYQPAWRFGVQRIAAVSLAGATPLVESAWFARALGFAAFGVFGRAVSLSMLVSGRLTSLLSTAIYPVLARIEPKTDAYRRASALYLRSVAWAVIPLAVVSALLAAPVVRLIYGDGWLDVIPLMPYALAGVTLAGLAQTGYMLLLAHHRQDRCFLSDLARLAGTLIALALLLGAGLTAYLSGVAVVNLITLGIVLHGLYRDDAVSLPGVFQALIPPVLAGAVAAVAVWVVLGMGGGTRVDPMLATSRAAIFLLLYLGLLRLCFRAELHELVGYLPRERQIKRFLLLAPATAPKL